MLIECYNQNYVNVLNYINDEVSQNYGSFDILYVLCANYNEKDINEEYFYILSQIIEKIENINNKIEPIILRYIEHLKCFIFQKKIK